ncbi:MAG: serine/threonine-protein kinase [Polyangiaceae bacterium]
MRLAEGTVIADRFRLVRALGRGGMGEVWLAHHIGLDTSCAVKFIHAHVAAAKDTRARFEREARVVAQLKSPHVVQVIDYGECEGMPYIAMEYLEGEDLGRRLHRLGRLAPMDTWLLLSQMARALGKAHAAGLVHRDLKPENVFLIRDDEHETAKILDFGIAKSTSVSISHGSTATGALLGTPSYMSPEQAQGIKSVDWRSDLWSMAVVAYRCLTGQLPFISEALGDLLVKIIVQPLPVPSHVAPDLPPGIDAWWARAAARDPAHRFQSAKELVEALGSALEISSAYARPSALYSQPYPGVPPSPSGTRYSGGQWTPQGAPGGVAPTTGDPVAQPSFGNSDPARDAPVQPTVPGISHTMANQRARRAASGS